MSRKKNINSYSRKGIVDNNTKTIKSRNKSRDKKTLLSQEKNININTSLPGYDEITNLLTKLSSKSFLSKEIKKDENQSIYKNEIEILEEPDEKSNITLKDHQLNVINILKKRRGLIVIHSTGSGKTITAVAASRYYLKNYPSRKVIIVSPLSLLENFKKNLIQYGVNDFSNYKFYTFNSFHNAIQSGLIECDKSMLIIDEAHNLKTESGMYALSAIKCAQICDRVLLLTATPLMNKPSDIKNLLTLIDGVRTKDILFDNYGRSIATEQTIKNNFLCKTSFYNPSKTEIYDYYPVYEKHHIYLVMDNNYYTNYRFVEKNIRGNQNIVELFGDESNLIRFFNGVRRAANNIEKENSPKINWCLNKIEESCLDEILYKAMIEFKTFKEFLDKVKELIENKNFKDDQMIYKKYILNLISSLYSINQNLIDKATDDIKSYKKSIQNNFLDIINKLSYRYYDYLNSIIEKLNDIKSSITDNETFIYILNIISTQIKDLSTSIYNITSSFNNYNQQYKFQDKFLIFSHFIEAGMELLIKRLNSSNIPFGHINGKMPASKRKEIIDLYNNNYYKVLLISEAGGEGLDLKETRYVIIVENDWNENNLNQVMGRAIRFNSHQNLPSYKRRVDVYYLYMIKPKEHDNLNSILNTPRINRYNGEPLSIDLYLRNYSFLKQQVIDDYLNKLKNYSIENNKC
jgi:superfamily II DNA or RNA helicase